MKNSPLLFLALVLVPTAGAQSAEWAPEPEAPLAARWAWAEARAEARAGGTWIGYGIMREMHAHTRFGSWAQGSRRPTLHEVLYGTPPPENLPAASGRTEAGPRGRKLVGLLFLIERGAVVDVDLASVDAEVDLEGRPLLWLGPAADGESLDRLEAAFAGADEEDLAEDLLAAVGVHEATPRVVSILRGVLTSERPDEIREAAAFWLGQQDDADALRLLVRTARADRSEDVREKAVFGLAQMDRPEALDALIDLARRGGVVREEAIFWLGQKAARRAVETLGELVEDDPETEIQKQAVFALSELPDGEGVPLLIEIARTHPKTAVRKHAIILLGHSEDPRALDALVELIDS